MSFTVFGSTGFIGSNMVRLLQKKGVACFTPARDYQCSKSTNLGHVIYSIGLTADFRTRPIDTVHAHVSKLIEVLENSTYESFLYLSTTRVYINSTEGKETADVVVNPNKPDDLYNISKLMGESVCLSYKDKPVKIARLSNVFGNDINMESFLYSILDEIKNTGKLQLRSSLHSEKDYIHVDDVVQLLFDIAVKGQQRLYNVASGRNLSNKEIIDSVGKYKSFDLEHDESAMVFKSPTISIHNIEQEFGFNATGITKQIEELIHRFFKNKHNDSD